MGGAGEYWALENGEALENGSRWRILGAGEWEALENGSRWRVLGAGE
jgi:hypothetical protein